MSTSAVSWTTRFLSVFRGPTSLTPANASDVREGVGDLAGSIMWLKTRLHDLLIGAEQRIIGRSGDQLEVTGHGIVSNAPVQVFATSGGSLPSPLAENTVYYLRDVDADHIELSATSGPGAAITLTSGISGDVWVQTVPDWITSLVVSNGSYGTGKFKDLVMWLAGAQTIAGAKTFASLTMSGTAKITLTARGKDRAVNNIGFSEAAGPISLPVSVAVGDVVDLPFEPPDGATITEVRVRVDPDNASPALPATLPKVALWRYAQDGTATTVGSQNDESVDFTAYRLAHYITLDGLSEVVDRSVYTYTVRFTQESALDGELRSCRFSAAVASYDDCAG